MSERHMGPAPVVRTSAAAQHPDSRAVRPGPNVGAGDDGQIAYRTDAAFRPAEIVMASDRGIDWADAGIGAVVTLASIVAAWAAALMIRRRRDSLAH